MKRAMTGMMALGLLAGCAQMPVPDFLKRADEPAPAAADTGPLDAIAPADAEEAAATPEVTDAPPPPEAARTAEQFDTTTAEDRAAAAAAPEDPTSERRIGTTIASLGDPSTPGLWLETPLVAERQQGRVRYPNSDKSALVELIPIEGPSSAGSRLSLPAMRLIDAPLTGLPEIEVFLIGTAAG